MTKTSNDIPLGAKPVDRAAHHRLDPEWLSNAETSDEVLICCLQGGELVTNHERTGLVWLGSEAKELPGDRIFMGKDKNGAPIFAINLPSDFDPSGSLLDGIGTLSDMRRSAGTLSLLEANIASTARSIFEWHRTHQFCSRCGAESVSTYAGWKRECPSCGAEHFPRTDPVAIMLPVKDDKCLLGRSPGWPEGLYSCLAGFVEPGETIEQAAAREVFEEAGIVCRPETAQYLFCQPWPFPSSLMVGLILEADTSEIKLDPNELEEAIWVDRAAARAIIDGQHEKIGAPFSAAIAYHVLKAWLEQ